MQHIIEGFNFQKEIFSQRKELFRSCLQPESQSAFHLLF